MWYLYVIGLSIVGCAESPAPDPKTVLRQNGVHDFQNHWVGLAEATANITNSTQPHGCWVCTVGPTSVQDGMSLVPEPLNATGLVAPMYWTDPYTNAFQLIVAHRESSV